jgi:hypothetical protein
MSKFSIAAAIIGLGALSIVTSGCAGELTEEQKERREGGIGTGGSGGGGSGGSGGASTGTGGTTGGNPEACVLALIKPDSKGCAITGCHAGSRPFAGLLLTEEVIRNPKDQLVDKPNKGNGGAVPGCQAGVAKLIDLVQPDKSLLYTKLMAQPPCGDRMPGGNPLSDAEMACVLNWIKSVASAP